MPSPYVVSHTSGISIHALREEGDLRILPSPSGCHISIHALREEGDRVLPLLNVVERIFLSTPSARRATIVATASSARCCISIHALREEGDSFVVTWLMTV